MRKLNLTVGVSTLYGFHFTSFSSLPFHLFHILLSFVLVSHRYLTTSASLLYGIWVTMCQCFKSVFRSSTLRLHWNYITSTPIHLTKPCLFVFPARCWTESWWTRPVWSRPWSLQHAGCQASTCLSRAMANSIYSEPTRSLTATSRKPGMSLAYAQM